jgi:hypothetical protein
MALRYSPPVIDVDADCPVCGGGGFIGDGDDVQFCDYPECSHWVGREREMEPDGADDQPDWRLAAMDCRYRESLGYPDTVR